jgi:hypothetical protein
LNQVRFKKILLWFAYDHAGWCVNHAWLGLQARQHFRKKAWFKGAFNEEFSGIKGFELFFSSHFLIINTLK